MMVGAWDHYSANHTLETDCANIAQPLNSLLDVLEDKMLGSSHRMRKACPFIVVWTILMLSLPACQDMFKGMGEMMALQQKLAKEFNTENVGIKITNGTHLGVTFQNSQIANLPKSEQQSKARQIASFVRDHYDAWRNLSTISVVFIQQNRYGPVSVTKTHAAFSFKPSELGSGLPQA